MVTALYRRYRPESFAEVIGQDHVTVPLMRALRNGRVGHAYLFSGPRGCGKTTSARILARCLNCVQGPTDSPCGQCDSCRDLSRGGPGSLDVVEIDAASHGGVDDARELRERATFAPARDRYKVFIIDEAHMVTSAGFNALLKLVEEPPEHVKFVFATTEPDKVIGTIRSRTHHYPFRLIPPQVLTPYLQQVCEAEGVQVGEGVLPLVVRAGGGSARDTLSVLDQLIAGSGEDGLDQATAINLLGFTDTTLLDQAITAIGQRDAASLYGTVEHVLATGHEPRRFVEDLLERLRDLIVLAAVPERGHELLPDTPADELERMREQVTFIPPVELSWCGDLVNRTLSTMSGATSPRLHLELLAARLLLRGTQMQPASGGGTQGRQAPAEQASAGHAQQQAPTGHVQQQAPTAPPGGASSGRDQARQVAQQHAEASRRSREQQGQGTPGPRPSAPSANRPEQSAAHPREQAPAEAVPSGAGSAPSAPAAEPRNDDGWGPVAQIPGRTADGDAPSSDPVAPAAASAPSAAEEPGTKAPAPQDQHGHAADAQQAGPGADDVRGHWSAIIDELQQIRRPVWALVSQHAHVADMRGGVLVLSFPSGGLLNAFQRGTGAENIAQAVRRVMHVDVQVEAVVDENPSDTGPGATGPGGGPGGPGVAGPGAGGPGAGGPGGNPNGGGPAGGVHGGGGPGASGGLPSSGTSGPASSSASSAPAQSAPAQASPARSPTPVQDQPPQPSSATTTPARPPAPEPDDFPPEPDDPFPPDPRDAPTVPRDVPAASAGTPAAPDPALSPDTSTRSPGVAGPAQPLEVEDEGRDALPPDEPRTYGQAALKRALAEGRVVRSVPAAAAAPDPATPEPAPAQHEPASPEPGSGPVEPPAEPPADPPTAAPSPAPEVDDWGPVATAAPVPEAPTSAPDAGAPVGGLAPSPTSPAATPQAAGGVPASSGAALAREAALASRSAGTFHRSPAHESPQQAAPPAEDPTGGASRDDADAQVATRTGREIAESVLGGRVLEVIDESP